MEDYGFKFKIGDRVTVSECARESERLNADTTREKWWCDYTKPLLIVRGRILEECYGGVQRHYDCRYVVIPSKTVGNSEVGFSAATTVAGHARFSEPELEAFAVATDAGATRG